MKSWLLHKKMISLESRTSPAVFLLTNVVVLWRFNHQTTSLLENYVQNPDFLFSLRKKYSTSLHCLCRVSVLRHRRAFITAQTLLIECSIVSLWSFVGRVPAEHCLFIMTFFFSPSQPEAFYQPTALLGHSSLPVDVIAGIKGDTEASRRYRGSSYRYVCVLCLASGFTWELLAVKSLCPAGFGPWTTEPAKGLLQLSATDMQNKLPSASP